MEAIAGILLILWCLGIVNNLTAGGLIHILLITAVLAIAIRITRRPSLPIPPK